MAVFIMSQVNTVQKWTLASVKLQDADTALILSHQALNVQQTSLDFYQYTTGHAWNCTYMEVKTSRKSQADHTTSWVMTHAGL